MQYSTSIPGTFPDLVAAGTLTVCQASVTHEGIVKDLFDALYDMNRHIDECAIDIKLYPTNELKQKVANLYAEIFSFLGDISQWIMTKKRKRFTASFNEGLRSEFQDKIAAIHAKSQIVKNHAAQSGRVEGRLTRLTAEQSSLDIKNLELNVQQNHSEMKHLGRLLIALLHNQGTAFIDEQRIQDLNRQIAGHNVTAMVMPPGALPPNPETSEFASGICLS